MEICKDTLWKWDRVAADTSLIPGNKAACLRKGIEYMEKGLELCKELNALDHIEDLPQRFTVMDADAAAIKQFIVEKTS